MLNIQIYDQNAKAVGKMDLNESVFGVDYNEALIHQVVVAQLANKRQGTKSTLTRAEVRGGGRKPWRQKGTGRARQGSIRSPQWIKGGVVFAPKPRDFSQKVNAKMKLAAIKIALSQKLRQNEIFVLNDIKIESPKTKVMVEILKKFDISSKVLIVTCENNEVVVKSARNIEKVSIISAGLINVYDVVANGKCLITKSAIEKIQEVYA